MNAVTDPFPRDEDQGDRMPLRETLEVLASLRGDGQAVITNQGSAREWPGLSDDPLDFHYIPSAMGGAIPLALGIALAQPERDVWVISGDGSLLMNLGCLVTIAAAEPRNLSVVLLDNGVYEVTGGQRTAGAVAGVDFAGLARAAGFPNVAQFRQLDDWRQRAAGVLAAAGPRFVWLRVEAVRKNFLLDPPCPIAEQLARFREALARDGTR